MVWNKVASRAVVPGPDLEDSGVPVLGTAAIAQNSPVQFGLGIHGDAGTSHRRGLPLYFVSKKAALARGSSVLKGWYVAAEPGKAFTLCLTLVNGNVRRVRGRDLNGDEGVSTELFVDGVKPGASSYIFGENSFVGQEIMIGGYRASVDFKGGRRDAKEDVRRFVFQKTGIAKEEVEDGVRNIGVIELRIFTGNLCSYALDAVAWDEDDNVGKKRKKVAEKSAFKLGNGIEVGAGDSPVTRTTWRSSVYVQRTSEKYEGVVTVYIREKFWLESRHIIDAEGRPWTPKILRTVINLDLDQPLGGKSKRLTSNSSSTQQSVAKKRKASIDLIDLTTRNQSTNGTKISEEIDLTQL